MTSGHLIADRWRLIERLGAGATGEVWLAFDEHLERQVAIKRLDPERSAVDPAARERMRREATAIAHLRHRNIVIVFDMIVIDGVPLIIMEYVPGLSLARRLQREPVLSMSTAARIGADIAAGLSAAHSSGVVHRDVKPANVMIDDTDGVAKLCDFGIAKVRGDAALTQSGMIIGTALFMAPEVAYGKPASAGSDVWSLGATLFRCLEGRAPFGDDDAASLTVRNQMDIDQHPRPQNAGHMADLLSAMLEPEPARRPTAADAARELQTIADNAATPVWGLGTADPQAAPEPPTMIRANRELLALSDDPEAAGATTLRPQQPDAGKNRRWPRRAAVLILISVVCAATAALVFALGRSPGGATARGGNSFTNTAGQSGGSSASQSVTPASRPVFATVHDRKGDTVGPDLTQMAAGVVRHYLILRIQLATTITAKDKFVIYIDADEDAHTGSRLLPCGSANLGADFEISFSAGNAARLLRSTKSGCEVPFLPTSADVQSSIAANLLRLAVPLANLGKISGSGLLLRAGVAGPATGNAIVQTDYCPNASSDPLLVSRS